MTQKEWHDRDTAFETALRKLREEYPEFYVEAWGPYDFVSGYRRDLHLSHNTIMDEILEKQDEWPIVVDELHEGFDANYGTNWDRINITVREVKRNASK